MIIYYNQKETFSYSYVKDRVYSNIVNDFLRNTLLVLDYLVENDIMTLTYYKNKPEEKTIDIIDTLITKAKEPVFIKEGNKNQYSPSTNTIFFKHTHGVMFRKSYKKPFRGKNIGYNSPMALLAHEIIHCYHELFDENGYLKRKKNHTMRGTKINQKGTDLSFPNKEEELVIRLTNQVIKRLGEDKRRNYGRDYYLTESVLGIEKKKDDLV